MPKFKISGVYEGNTVEEKPKKDGSGNYLAGFALVKIDNSYTDQYEERIEKLVVVPFKVFGKTAQLVQNLQFEQKVTMACELEGREYNGKWYSEVKALNIKADSEAVLPVKDIEF